MTPLEGEANPEEEFEQLRESLFGQLDELVVEAEDLLEDQGREILAEDADTAQLWEELKERAVATRQDFDLKKGSFDEALRVRLEGFLTDLEERAETVFGGS